MPIYEYRCRKCGHKFEHLARSFTEKPPACPECHTADCERLISTFNTSSSASKKSPCEGGVCPVSASSQAGQCCPNCYI